MEGDVVGEGDVVCGVVVVFVVVKECQVGRVSFGQT